jgi:hemerythrin-like domain-containing protein
MSATEELKYEHRIIERMLGILNAAATKVDQGQGLPPQFFPKVVDFIRNFADKCHHGKEEDTLFPALEEHGIPKQTGPLAVMLAEHDQGRTYVRGMDEANKRYANGDKKALEAALDNARGYSELLRQHIDKEDNILYVMADQVLTDTKQQELLRIFGEVERERIGSGKHEEYVKLVEDLEGELGLRQV